jgi:hypothetical protein
MSLLRKPTAIVERLFDYATLSEVLEGLQQIEQQQGQQYADTMTDKLLSALENNEDPAAIAEILVQLRQAKAAQMAARLLQKEQ